MVNVAPSYHPIARAKLSGQAKQLQAVVFEHNRPAVFGGRLRTSGVNRPLVPVAVLFSRRTGSRQSWVVSTFRSRSRSRSRTVLE